MRNKNLSFFLNDDEIPINENILYKRVHNNIFDNNNINNKNSKKNKNFYFLLLVIFLLIFIFCIFKLVSWCLDNNNTDKNIDDIESITEIQEIKDSSNTELVNEPKIQESDYWYYIKMSLIQVDFNELIKKNSDTVGWIQVNNTNINYPIVQTLDNDYYLDHSYDKSSNEAGWVFMDFRNDANFTSKNTIIYAHSRLDKTMFGSLSKLLKSNWYENKDNHIIKISTPIENSLWQIFSVYKIKAESFYITTDFESNTDYLEFLNTLRNRSKYNFDTTLGENDTIITLSTCYSETERTVVHAKKIKKSTR